ncbi:MAG: DsrE family protein [Kofleriaceae bacterium]
MSRTWMSLFAALAIGACSPSLAEARPGRAAAPAQTTRPSGSATRPASAPAVVDRSLVFVLTTGLEDAQRMSSVFRHARTAAQQGRLREVVVVVYGRGAFAFDGAIAARPPQLADTIRQAMAAGVRIQLCAHALDQLGIDRARLDPQPTEVVPNAIATLVDHVARGAAVVSY